MTKRLDPQVRKDQILAGAMKLAQKNGFDKVTREDVAKEVGIANGLVSRYWGTMAQLRRAIIREAITSENLTIIGQGLAARNGNALKAPEALREAAAKHLMG